MGRGNNPEIKLTLSVLLLLVSKQENPKALSCLAELYFPVTHTSVAPNQVSYKLERNRVLQYRLFGVGFVFSFLFPGYQNCPQLFTDKNASAILFFLLARFLGLCSNDSAAVAAPSWSQQGEQRGRWMEKLCTPFADCFLIVFHCVFVQFNFDCPRDRVYYPFRLSHQGEISESNKPTFSYLLFSHSSKFFKLFVTVINFSPYCAHACLVVRN